MNLNVHPKDFHLVPAEPDPDFSAEHNKSVIESVIEETDKIAKNKRKEFEDKLGERTSAVARFIERVKSGIGESDVEGYFGKKMLNYLSGKEDRLLDRLTVIGKNGRVIRRTGQAYGQKEG